jgi:hypothetical protein
MGHIASLVSRSVRLGQGLIAYGWECLHWHTDSRTLDPEVDPLDGIPRSLTASTGGRTWFSAGAPSVFRGPVACGALAGTVGASAVEPAQRSERRQRR